MDNVVFACITPHGLLIDNTISILDNSKVDGRTGGPGELGATTHGYSMTFDVARDLNAVIAAAGAGVPVAHARNFRDFVSPHIDFGSLNPLWFLGGIFSPPKLVVVAVGPGVPRPQYVGFGRTVRAAAAGCGRTIAWS